MSTNNNIIRKADWAFTQFNTGNDGALNPEQARAFIRKLLVEPTLMQSVRTVTMNAPQRKIPKIQFAERVMRAGVQGGNKITLDENTANRQRSRATTEQIELNAREVIAEIRLPYETIEDSIEQGNIGTSRDGGGASSGGIVETIMSILATRVAVDLEELILLGDSDLVSSDPYLGQVDGYLKRVEQGNRGTKNSAPNNTSGNIVDVDGAGVSRSVFKDGLKAMPTQYLRLRNQMRHYVSIEQEMEYRDTIAERESAAGDAQMAQVTPVYAGGVQLQGVGLMPQTKGMLAHPSNLIMGIYRGMHIESDKLIADREYQVVLTMRIDVQIEEAEATVLYDNIGTD